MLVPVLSPDAALADHDRPANEGTWTVSPDLTEVVTQYEHHNPWECTNPPSRYDSSLGITVEEPCSWPLAYAPVSPYLSLQPQGTAPRGGLVVTRCRLGFNQGADCGHTASSSQWTFAGSNHHIHLDDRAIATSYVCSAAAGTASTSDHIGGVPKYQSSYGLLYDANGHPAGHSGALCGTFTPSQPTVCITGTTVTEGESAVLTITAVGGSGSGTVQYTTRAGTAGAGSDYSSQTGVHSFSGPGTRTVTVPTTDDDDIDGAKTFTVSLSNPSGVTICPTATATVTILDNDSAPPPTCPAGQTGTPPNCQPIVVLTGCDAPGTRLRALTVTAGGSSVLSGFSATTYSYALTADASSAVVAATAATSTATVGIGTGSAATGAATSTVYLTRGSDYDIDVVVTSGGESCTYSLAISRPGENLVPSCPAGTILIIDSGYTDGYNCVSPASCPYELYNYDPQLLQYAGIKVFGPLWLGGASEAPAVPEGGSSTLERTALSCTDYFRSFPQAASSVRRHCVPGTGWNNLHANGDCMKFSMRVTAVSPEAEGWHYVVASCGYNRYAAIASTWTADDAVCKSSAAGGRWQRTSACRTGWALKPHCSATAPTEGIGEWQVSWGSLTERSASQDNPYVDVPIVAEVTDWGDLSHLSVTLTAETRGLYDLIRAPGAYYASWNQGLGFLVQPSSASTTVSFPRRSGPPPSDDIVEVNVAALAALPSSSQRYAEIRPADLLANDACPVGVDCTDPLQWPIRFVGERNKLWAAINTTQGLLDDRYDPPRYRPELWAAGEDTFTYSTYGGEATVTIQFTDRPPQASDISAHDPGSAHTAAPANLRRTGSTYGCVQWNPYGYCIRSSYTGWGDYRYGSGWSATHHSGAVSLNAVRDSDPDGDGASVVITDGLNPHLAGRSSAIINGTATSTWGTEQRTLDIIGFFGDYVTPCTWTAVSYYGTTGCVTPGLSSVRLNPVNPTDQTSIQTEDACVANTASSYRISGPLGSNNYTGPNEIGLWTSAAATDPGCVPATLPADCQTGATGWWMCYSLWPDSAAPAPLVVDYRTCDDRLTAFNSDRSDAEAAGRSEDDYCTEGTVTVYLGDTRGVTLSSSTYAVDEGAALDFEVQLTQASTADVVVDYTVTDGTALAGSDYTAPTGQVRIPAGDTTATISVATTADTTYETDETLLLQLTSATGATLASITQAYGTILNDDPAPVISLAADVSAVEDDTVNGGAITFAVNLTGATALPASVNYSTAAGTATATSVCPAAPGDASRDYLGASGTLAFAPGDTSKHITVSLCLDDQVEPDETFTLTLSGETGATLGTATAAGTILDDDTLSTISVDGPTSAITEDTAGIPSDITFTVRLDMASHRTVDATVSTASGTATGGTCGSLGIDYASRSTTISFAPGVTTYDFVVRTCADTTQNEGTEDFTVSLSGVSNAALGTSSATGEIADNDVPPPEVSISDASADESNSIAFTLTLDAATSQVVTVTATTAASSPVSAAGTTTCTAVDGSEDYENNTSTVTFAANTTTATFTVTVCDDTAAEPDETFSVTLSGPSGATISSTAGTATGTIVDNDRPPCGDGWIHTPGHPDADPVTGCRPGFVS